MSALEILMNISSNENLACYDFRYCLVDSDKHPFTINNVFARPNQSEDFVKIDELLDAGIKTLDSYEGLGVSVQASNICAIDIDHCASNKFDIKSLDSRAKDIIEMVKDFAYVEFSFSGNGVRIFFKAHKIDNYEQIYYTKNSKENIEYYYPEGSARYVTITGKTIINNCIKTLTYGEQQKLMMFLSKYMKRKHELHDNNVVEHKDDRTLEDLMKLVKYRYMTNNSFQDVWFSLAPGSGHDESERDYKLIAEIYDNITKDKDKIKQIFEQSPFFKSKDWKHVNKWTKQDFRYFNYVFERVQQKHRS